MKQATTMNYSQVSNFKYSLKFKIILVSKSISMFTFGVHLFKHNTVTKTFPYVSLSDTVIKNPERERERESRSVVAGLDWGTEGLLMVSGSLFRVLKMFWNVTVVSVPMHCACTKCHQSVHFKCEMPFSDGSNGEFYVLCVFPHNKDMAMKGIWL